MKRDIWPKFSKCNIRPQFEGQIRISSVKTRYSASIGMSEWDFEYHNSIIGPISKVKKKIPNVKMSLSASI